jgi:8-oxo-dGTP diphosphatase
MHTISTVFMAQGSGIPHADDDAANLALFTLGELPATLCFDHARILADYAAVAGAT